jgi:UDP-N-acetylmuramoyl-tripeptide--D-alanyl-D-alanine ligase
VSHDATVRLSSTDKALDLRHGRIKIALHTGLIGIHMHKTLAAAYLVGDVLNLDMKDEESSLAAVTAMPGRMNKIKLACGATAIDDSYNASPEAVIAALDALYATDTPRKIAVIGNMNEMGAYSQAEHERVGQYCDNKQLEEIIVIGPDAKTFLAQAAQAGANRVVAFDSPYAIADYLKPKLNDDVIILFKGSQNGVFLEEAIKPLLAQTQDASRLVRQSSAWLRIKSRQFSS